MGRGFLGDEWQLPTGCFATDSGSALRLRSGRPRLGSAGVQTPAQYRRCWVTQRVHFARSHPIAAAGPPRRLVVELVETHALSASPRFESP